MFESRKNPPLLLSIIPRSRSFFWYLELIDSFESCQVKVLTISKPRYSLAYVFAEHRLSQGEIGRIPALSTSTTNREFDYEY